LRWVDPYPLFTLATRHRLERAFLQPLVPEHVSVAIPPQRLDAVPPLVDEQEQAAVGGIATERAPNEPRTSPERAPNEPRTSPERAPNEPRTSPERAPNEPRMIPESPSKLFRMSVAPE
jgi:hypothetical protein